MLNTPMFPSSTPVAPSLSIEQIESSSPTLPAATREIARATLDDTFHRELKWLAYESNPPKTRRHLVANLRGILTMLWVTDGLKGETAQDAFFIRYDHTTMTQTDFDKGLLVCEVGMAPVRPSEFVTFRIRVPLRP